MKPPVKPCYLACAMLLCVGAASAADPQSTVGSVTEHNGLKHNWPLDLFPVEIKTPSILRVTNSKPLHADPRMAIAHYDAVIALQPDKETLAESMRRAGDLRVELADASGHPESAEQQAELHQAIALYQRLLAEQPDYVEGDRVVYQLARASEMVGDNEGAIAALHRFDTHYAGSPRRGDGLFRVAELLFQGGRYEEAEAEYHAVLAAGPGPAWYEPARYKYGWSLYEQGKYGEALPVFLALLDRNLPAGDLSESGPALAGVERAKSEMTADTLRVTLASFAALGGGKAVNDYFSGHGEPRYSLLIYNALGAELLERHRYTDAADTYSAYAERHAGSPLAPQFQAHAIAALEKGGFDDLAEHAKEKYVQGYAPNAPYWSGGRAPDPAILAEVRKDLDELGPYYQARAQATAAKDPAAARADFVAAASWYRRSLEMFPQDPKAAEINLHLADALYDGGQTQSAAEQYQRTAYAYPNNAKAPEAAYAAVQAWQRLATEVPPDQKEAALKESAAASVKLADAFPNNPQSAPVLTRAAEDLFSLHDVDQAATIAQRVINSPGAAPDQRTQALGVVADSRFAQARYADAEAAYTQLLAATPPNTPAYKTAVEQLAAAIYKQGAAARDSGDLRTAAADFQRVGRLAPTASIRPNADYDAASAFVALGDWQAAEPALEDFRARYPNNPLQADVDKKLALAYQKDNKPQLAAAAFLRIAQRPSESPETRRDASWLAATTYDQAHQGQASAKAYELYLQGNAQPLDRAMEARRRLADLAKGSDPAGYLHWLNEIVAADGAAGGGRDDASHLMAAQACLELARLDEAHARELSIELPINKSLPRRKAATETAIATLSAAAGYGYADITTAATYELGQVYQDLGRALLDSERPGKLKSEELDQYNELPEEQAEPFDEEAMKAHEANLERMKQGLWNDWIQKSAQALASLAPAKYGKHELGDDLDDSIR